MSQKYEIVDGLYVGPEVWEGDLYLRNTDIQSLGKLKVVSGDVVAEGVSTLCDLGCLKEVGYLDIRGTSIASLGILKKVKGYLRAVGVSTLCDLGCLEEVDRYLDIRGTSINSLGSLTKVGTFYKDVWKR